MCDVTYLTSGECRRITPGAPNSKGLDRGRHPLATSADTCPAADDSWTPRLIVSLISIVLLLEMLTISYIMIATIGSFVSALAPTHGVMIVGRALTGLLVPCLFLSCSLIRDVFPAKTVARAVSRSTIGMGLIAIPSPFITG